MLKRSAIRQLVEAHGPRGYLQIQAQLLGMTPQGRIPTGPNGKAQLRESVELPNGRKLPRRRPTDFSIRALWEGLVGPVEETLAFAMDQVGLVEIPQQVLEQVTTGAFPSAVGQLIATMVIEGYEDDAGFIGDELVAPMPSSVRNERIVGFTALQGPKEVLEGQTYEDSSFAEKYVTSRETKRGRLLSVTEEAVFFDQTGQILERARQLGYYARQARERRIVRAVIDADSGEAVYQPGGTGEQLYSSGNNNLISTNTPLVDWTDIQEVLTHHATNIVDDRQADDSPTSGGQPLVWMPRQLLTAVELAGVAARIISATQYGGGSDDTVSGNPLNTIVPGLRPLSSPFIDNATDGDQWDDASDWFLGDFPRQFKEKIIWPLQTFRAPAQNDEQFERDIVARYKVRDYSDVVAVDERWVIKVNAA